ncbi:MAG: amidohydrolase family protein [Pseudohongiellaceae bacterium]
MMKTKGKVNRLRRKILQSSAIGGVALTYGAPFAKAQSSAMPESLMRSREFLLKGGYVLSMDNDIGDIAVGDVHIRDGEIIDIAPAINAPQAEMIDATDRVIMPGFVETHWHMLVSHWRGIANDAADYFRLSSTLEPFYRTEDHYTAVRYSALDALNAGVTTCHNWSEGMLDQAGAIAEMQALVDSGIRAKMGYSAFHEGTLKTAAEMERTLAWINENGEGRLGLGLLLDGAPAAQMAAAVELGRSYGLWPISDHSGGLDYLELAGPEFIVTHGPGLTEEAMRQIAQNNLKVALSPLIDPMIGGGLAPIYPLIANGVPLENISFSIDASAQTPVDPFASLRAITSAARMQQVQSNRTGQVMGTLVVPSPETQWEFSNRDAVYIGTYGGANVLGLADQIGSLTPGKKADVIMVRTDMINMLPNTDSDIPMQLIQHAITSNIDTVFVDGSIKKFNGILLDEDLEQIIDDAAQLQRRLRQQAAESNG